MYVLRVTCLFILIISAFKGQHVDNSCWVSPRDHYIEVGSDTEIVCQTSCVSDRVFWTLNNIRMDDSLSNTVNSSHTVLSLRNFTLQSATLECHEAHLQQVLAGTIVTTYTKPSNISCFLHYEPQRRDGIPHLITCKWEHMITSSLSINYTVYVSSVLVTRGEICVSREKTCTTNTSGIIVINRKFNVTVIAKTTAWEAYSEPYEFIPLHILKMPRLSVNVLSLADHLKIEWNRSLQDKPCHCQVKFVKIVSSGEFETVFNETLNSKKNGRMLKEVESCTNYNIAVRCALEHAPWSEWGEEKTVLTQLNKNHIELRLWRKISKPDEYGVRNVRVMWTGIPSTCQGTFSYTLKKVSYRENASGENVTELLCSNTTCSVDVTEDAHSINLTVLLNEAVLAEDSVYVPATTESLPEPTEIQPSASDGVISVRWTAPVQPVSGYMIDWTQDGTHFNWKETKYTNMTLRDLLEKKQYNITVTALFEDKTGHGAEAPQICSSLGGPGNITVSVQANHRSANVTWVTKSEEKCSAPILTFTIVYSHPKGPMQNVTVDSTNQDVVLEDLIPATEYSLYVKAASLTGTSRSGERYFSTKRFDPRLIPGLITSSAIIIVLVIILGWCCTAQCKKKVPDPALSSLATWPPPGHQKGMCPFHDFSNSRSFCGRVYTEEMQITHSPPAARDCNANTSNEQSNNHTDPTVILSPEAQNGEPIDFQGTKCLCFGESTVLLSPENNKFNPYRSQISVDSPPQRSCKHNKHAPVKQQEKSAPVMVYVTLNMFKQGQSR